MICIISNILKITEFFFHLDGNGNYNQWFLVYFMSGNQTNLSWYTSQARRSSPNNLICSLFRDWLIHQAYGAGNNLLCIANYEISKHEHQYTVNKCSIIIWGHKYWIGRNKCRKYNKATIIQYSKFNEWYANSFSKINMNKDKENLYDHIESAINQWNLE